MGGSPSRHFFLAAVVLLLAAGVPAFAQTTGEITGQVQDAQGQPLQGAQIKLLKAGGSENQQQASGADGGFRFEGLASGVYIAMASLDGYAQVTCPGVRLVAGLSRNLAIQMAPEGSDPPSSCKAVEPAAPSS
jgi:hypothetical protein